MGKFESMISNDCSDDNFNQKNSFDTSLKAQIFQRTQHYADVFHNEHYKQNLNNEFNNYW